MSDNIKLVPAEPTDVLSSILNLQLVADVTYAETLTAVSSDDNLGPGIPPAAGATIVQLYKRVL